MKPGSKNSRLFMLVFLVLSFGKLCCQYSVAGVPGSVYTDIVPDTALGGGQPPTIEEYYVDINQDGISDVKIKTDFSYSPGHTYTSTDATALTTQTKLAFGHKDSTFHTYFNSWFVTDILKQYNQLDTIDSSGFTGINSAYLAHNLYSAGTAAINNEWIGAGDKYIGVSYTDQGITNYGWIKVNVNGYASCTLMEHSYLEPVVTIRENKRSNTLVIYPNPASDEVVVKIPEAQEAFVSLANAEGKEIGVPVIRKDAVLLLNTKEISSGIYILRVQLKDEQQYSKIVVSH
jgi:hypothetical protein